MWQYGGFFWSFLKAFSRDISCPITAGLPGCHASISLLPTRGARLPRMGGGLWLLHVHRTMAHGSAAPPAGLRGLLPKFDCSVVSIFMGVQGWDLATWNKEEASIDFLFSGRHHIQTDPASAPPLNVRVMQEIEGSRNGSFHSFPPSLLPSLH